MSLPENVGRKDLASVLHLSERRVSQLAAEGVISQVKRGVYPLRQAIQEYFDYRFAAVAQEKGNPAADRLREARAREIELRIAERDRHIIDLAESMYVLDTVVGETLKFVGSIPAILSRDRSERRRVEDALFAAQQKLSDRFKKIQMEHRTGEENSEPDDD